MGMRYGPTSTTLYVQLKAGDDAKGQVVLGAKLTPRIVN